MLKKNLVLVIISILVILLSLSSTFIETQDYQFTYMVDKNGQTILPNYISEDIIGKIKTEQDIKFTNYKIAEDFFNIKENNTDTVGWLSIPDICYYPVLYNGDNQYYLRRDIEHKYNIAGSIFMNKLSLGDFLDTALIHGHRMNDGTMFGSLSKYKDETFFRENDLIEVFDGTYSYYYKPFTVFTMLDGKDYIHQSWNSDEERLEYMNLLYEQSIVTMEEGLSPKLENQTLFLSTCEGSIWNKRLVVGYYLLGKAKYDTQNESEQQLLDSGNELSNIFK